ncbi:MAG: putative sulfate/molybdate transporter [Smithellaceae bacterium]|nr:putative sulfate/molybdate transporter [Smithellaceae bacterium]
MRIGSFQISLQELAGSFGGFGIIFPLAIGYIMVCGLDPAGVFVMLGLTNLIFGLYYRLPLPLEPMKVLAVMAIAQAWSPSLVYASGFAMGLVWLLFSLTRAIDLLRRITPDSVVRGVQLALGILLFIQAVKMLSGGWILGGVSVVLILLLRKSRHIPGALALLVLGLFIIYFQGHFPAIYAPGFFMPSVTSFKIKEAWDSLLLGGFAQIPLTVTNAVIATAGMIRTYWPERSDVSERKLALNHGIMNLAAPFFGGMPMCHGAGSLAGKYYFGARTGAASIMEGLIEIALGLFLAASLVGVFRYFPPAILGGMLLFISIELAKFARGSYRAGEITPLMVTTLLAVTVNMAAGFLAGLLTHYLWRLYVSRNKHARELPQEE